jgi:hypothetical protein
MAVLGCHLSVYSLQSQWAGSLFSVIYVRVLDDRVNPAGNGLLRRNGAVLIYRVLMIQVISAARIRVPSHSPLRPSRPWEPPCNGKCSW